MLRTNTSSEVADLAGRVANLEAQLALAERHHVAAFWRALDNVYDQILPSITLTCIICGFASKRDGFAIRTSKCIFGGGRLERYGCPVCECIFGAKKFLDQDEDFISLDYQLLYSRYSEGDTTKNEVSTFHSLSPARDGTYVNWGSGGAWNSTIKSLRHDGWLVWGYEPSSPQLSQFVVTKREDLPQRVDGIFSNNVIEHFLDPVAQFKDFHALLPPGGLMAHSTACYEYAYEYSRFHTVFLTGRSPHVLAERTGFEVIERKADGEYINVIFKKV